MSWLEGPLNVDQPRNTELDLEVAHTNSVRLKYEAQRSYSVEVNFMFVKGCS